MKLARTPAGNLLVTDAGRENHTGRLSLVTRAGSRTTVLEGLPAAVAAEGTSGPTAIEVAGSVVYVAIGEGDTLVAGPRPGSQVPNPRGAASPLFSTILQLRLPVNVDALTAGYTLSQQDRARLADGQDVRLESAQGAATISVLADFRDYTPDPNTIVRGSNPFGLALDPDLANTLWVADAGQNAVLRVDTQTGRSRVHSRIPPFPVPGGGPPPVMDSVVTSVRSYGAQLLVTCLPGFPFPAGEGRVLAISKETGAIEPFINGLSGAMDVIWAPRSDGRSQFFTLEFSANMGAQPPPPGRLTQYDSPNGAVVAPVLITPVSMEIDAAAGELYVTELALGRIVMVRPR
jgi:DNA-binding beta-propeller fold protein YncE